MPKPIIYHIPVCPFSQRVEILLALKGLTDAIEFRTIDVTKPRDPELLDKMRGTTAFPVLETEDRKIIKESLVILRYIEDRFPAPPVARTDPYERAVENMLIATEGPFTMTGYLYVLNQDPDKRADFEAKMLAQYAQLNDFLSHHAPDGPFLFKQFGLAEAVFTPMFMRFWFLEYYEGFTLPDTSEYSRVRQWHDACIAHPAAQQVCHDEIVKLYYDYAKGEGNGALLPGRTRSSFALVPDWRNRPMPPRDKWCTNASDATLGLV